MDSIMDRDRTETAPQEKAGVENEQLEQELYAALRAAGASPEDAQYCVKADAQTRAD